MNADPLSIRKTGTTHKRPDVADYRTPPLLRQWYVAGYRSDFGEALREITILNRSLVTYRTSTGEPVILRNRCAHRSFPLSESWREGDAIRCRYHGAMYNSEGRLVDLPSQKSCPNVTVTKYPARERGPFVWVWMAPCEPDDSLLPEMPFDMDTWAIGTDYSHVASNVFFMVENLADVTHIPFLHKETLKYPKEFARTTLAITVENDIIRFCRKIENRFYHRTVFFPKATSDRIDPHPYETESISYWVNTAFTYFNINVVLGEAVAASDAQTLPVYRAIVAHFLTPETDSTCHYWWCQARNYDVGDHAFTTMLSRITVAAFNEDKDTCAHLQKMVDHDQHPFREALFAADKLAVTMRRIVQRKADEEALLFGS